MDLHRYEPASAGTKAAASEGLASSTLLLLLTPSSTLFAISFFAVPFFVQQLALIYSTTTTTTVNVGVGVVWHEYEYVR